MPVRGPFAPGGLASYEFENLISDYLEGELSFSKRKEFESYFEENEDAKLLFLNVKDTLNNMKNAEKISTSENFNSKLLSKIKDKAPLLPSDRSNIFGLSPLHASIFCFLYQKSLHTDHKFFFCIGSIHFIQNFI